MGRTYLPDVKTLKINNREVTIDDEDFDRVSRITWYIDQANYVRHKDRKWQESLHRFILGVSGPCDYEIDHINGNGLDNRRCNLRKVQHWENMHNRSIQSNNRSGHKGVSWNPIQHAWHSYIWINKKRLHLGYHKDWQEAVRVREEAETIHLGHLNLGML